MVDRVLNHESPVAPYEPGTWGPAAAADVVASAEGWHDPQAETSEPC